MIGDARGVHTLVIGDVRDIRQNLDYGKKINQKLHQWTFGQSRWQLSYKWERLGGEVALQNEAYTSQDCPECGLILDRDVNAARNILTVGSAGASANGLGDVRRAKLAIAA